MNRGLISHLQARYQNIVGGEPDLSKHKLNIGVDTDKNNRG